MWTISSPVLLLLVAARLGCALSPGYGAPQHEYPTENCTVSTVSLTGETCTPTFTQVCEPVTILAKVVVDKEQCYPVTKTVCTDQVVVVPNEICVYKYEALSIETEASTVSVSYSTPCVTQMVTVCAPGYGYEEVNCKDVEQETCYNAPELSEDVQPRTVVVPEPQKVCQDKPIDLVTVQCEDITSEKCITVPEVIEEELTEEVCRTELGEPDCNEVTLDLPKESCIELVYGYTHGYEKH